MPVRWGLLKFLWRRAVPVTVLSTLALALLALCWPDVLTPRDFWPGVIVLVQCMLLAKTFGRFASPTFAFTVSRGYSRDALWGHMMLASGLSAITAWLVAGLVLWTGLRGGLHDLWQSPYFPVMAPREATVPLTWLALYGLLLPACHYGWIRAAQPTRDGHGGTFVILGLLVALLVGFRLVRHLDGWLEWLVGVLYVIAVVCLVAGGRILHRSLEVRA